MKMTVLSLCIFLCSAISRGESMKFPNLGLGAAPIQFRINERQFTYEDSGGEGPVLLCIPGLGDTRAQFRFLAPLLVQQGYRVVVVDPRGQGSSDVGWDDYSADAIAQDMGELINSLGRDVYIIGNSAGAGVAVSTAADRPDRVKGLILLGPFVRDVPASFIQKLFMKVAFFKPWAVSAWAKYYRSIHTAYPPADLDEYIENLKQNLREPGRMAVVKKMIFSSKKATEMKIADVKAPVLVMMGEKDPDFSDPQEEAELVGRLLHGQVEIVPRVGHYPHIEVPELTLEMVKNFVDTH